jgi:hypothetical protein
VTYKHRFINVHLGHNTDPIPNKDLFKIHSESNFIPFHFPILKKVFFLQLNTNLVLYFIFFLHINVILFICLGITYDINYLFINNKWFISILLNLKFLNQLIYGVNYDSKQFLARQLFFGKTFSESMPSHRKSFKMFLLYNGPLCFVGCIWLCITLPTTWCVYTGWCMYYTTSLSCTVSYWQTDGKTTEKSIGNKAILT